MNLPAHSNHSAHAGHTPASGHSPGAPTPPSGGPSKPTYSKRGKITIVACVNCRRRKTKCDGHRPVCSQCRTRDGPQCHYDMNEEQRRLTYLRENVEQLHEEKSSLENLIYNLRISSEEEAIEILRRLRHGTDAQTLSQNIQAGRALAQVSRPGSEGTPTSTAGHPDIHGRLLGAIVKAAPGETEEIIRRLRLSEDAGNILNAVQAGTLIQPLERSGIYSGAEQAFGLTRVGPKTPVEIQPTRHAEAKPTSFQPLTLQGITNSSLTKAPYDDEIVNHSLGLYFSWQHCLFQSFPQNLFLQDMASGSTQYCSKLLVNAICSAGCLLSPWPNLPAGNQRPLELSRIFFDEATRELANVDQPSIPTLAGLFILSHVEGYRGQMHRAWDYCGRSARMALDLNLHRREDGNSVDEVETMARKNTFWGCFIADQLLSFTLGRIPQIPTTAITIDLPTIVKEDDDAPWEPFGDGSRTKVPGARSTIFHEVASLSKILNSTLYLFFAPSQTLKGSLLLDEYNKYKAWYHRLPPIVGLANEASPHVLSLHMYYHAAILLLFRPFLKAKFTQSDISPSEACRSSAAQISMMFDQHRRTYDSVGIYTLQIHCLLAACTIHIINTPAIASTAFLTSAAGHFHHLAPINGWAVKCIQILKDLVHRWQIVLPMEAEQALYQDAPEGPVFGGADSGRGKRSALSQPNIPPTPQQKKPKLSASRTSNVSSSSPVLEDSIAGSLGHVSVPNNTSSSRRSHVSGSSMPIETLTTSTMAAQLNHSFAPFPSQPVPLLRPMHTSDSQITEIHNQMLQQPLADFDGLTFEGGADWFDPFMGYSTGVSYGEGDPRM